MSLVAQQQTQILHVDDEPNLTDLTQTALEREDRQFAVETATSAEEGLRIISDRPPDCVVSDYNMPGMDGLEFLEAVREEYSDLPFILFTGKGSEAVASDAISAGVTDYLQKQSGTEQYDLLANRIRNAVRARRHAAKATRQEELMRITELVGKTGGWELDRDSRRVLLTAGARRIFGRPDETELALQDLIQLFHPDDREAIQQTLDEAFETGEEMRKTWRLQPREGDERIIEVNVTPVVENGEITRLRGAGHDVTDQKARKQELEAVNSQYQTLVENFPDGAVFLFDSDLQYVQAGGQELAAVGLSPDDVKEATPHEIFPDAIAHETAGYYQDTLDGASRTFEQAFGGERYRIQTVPVRTGNGTIAYGMAVSTNITEQTKRRQELERQNDLFTKAQNIATIGAWAHDIDSGTLTWTDQVYEIHNVSSEFDPSLDRVMELYHPDDQSKLREAVNQAITAGEPYDLEVRMTARDDGVRWIRTVADPQCEDGEVVRVRGVVYDITDRTERKQELRRYEHFFENSPDQIALLDETLTVQYQSSPSALHELDTLEIEGDDPFEYVHPDDRQALVTRFEALLTTPDESLSEEFRAKDASSEWRWMEARAINLLNEEPAEGILVIIRDITQLKRQQLELERQNERLEEFTRIVSHDLRNPLTVADGHLELAEEHCESEHIARAADAVDRSQGLITDLLTLAREGDSGAGVERVDVATVAERSWQTVNTGQATLEIDVSLVVETNGSRLQQLFENLYRNAVEHGGDDVTVSVGTMDDGFYVADTGSGIPESDREAVFEAGYSNIEDGTGFGLRIVEQVAEANGWEITLTESEQSGARFEITGVEFEDR